MSERIFSKKCSNCGERAVTLEPVSYTVQVAHDGSEYSVVIPDLVLPKCARCGNISLDEEANRQISAAFRHQAGLLSPEEIRQQRTSLKVSHEELADFVGADASSVRAWESGIQVQQRSADRLLRIFFEFPQVRQQRNRQAI